MSMPSAAAPKLATLLALLLLLVFPAAMLALPVLEWCNERVRECEMWDRRNQDINCTALYKACTDAKNVQYAHAQQRDGTNVDKLVEAALNEAADIDSLAEAAARKAEGGDARQAQARARRHERRSARC